MKSRRKKLNRKISYILLFSILLNGLIFNLPISYGAAKGKVTITNVYTGFTRTEKRITVDDQNIKDYQNKRLQIQSEDDKWHTPRNINIVGQTIVQAELDPSLIIKDAIVAGVIPEGEGYREVASRYSGINEKGIPEILNVDKPIVKTNEPIILNMKENAKDLVDGPYTITVGGVESKVELVPDTNQIKLMPKQTNQQFPRGIRDIIVRSSQDMTDYNLETSSVYKNAVRITGELSIEGVTMFPTMGEPGSKVTFTRSSFPSPEGYDIYFIKDLNNPEFISRNMGRNQSINLPAREGDNTVITVEVPNLSSGPYYIVFTNKDSQRLGIDSTYVLDQQYQIVTISQKPIIESVQPNSAPSGTATSVKINGNYFVNHNVPGFKPDNLKPTVSDVNNGDEKININYGVGELTLPDGTGGSHKHKVEVKREIEVDIGRVLGFKVDNENKGFDYDLDDTRDPNTFAVETKNFEVDETQIEDVIVRVKTIITGVENSDFNAEMQQEIVVRNGFTYYPSTEKPNIDRVVPDTIPVEEINGEYYLDSSMGRLLLSIEGEKFLVTRYKDGDQEKINYPKITLGGTVINPNAKEGSNEHKPLKFEVLNDGKLVDGTGANEIGNRILIELKAGVDGFKITNKESRIIYIRNPLRQSNAYSGTNWDFVDKVRFEEINKNDFPVIENVRPSLVSIDGGEDVAITGSNFRPGAQVYIENKLVSGANIAGDGKTITLKAPKGSRPGETLLQVINPEGGN